jgi:hypothetical protein
LGEGCPSLKKYRKFSASAPFLTLRHTVPLTLTLSRENWRDKNKFRERERRKKINNVSIPKPARGVEKISR